MRIAAILITSICLAGGALAQDEHLKGLPGYVEFQDLSDVYGEPKVMINIGGSLLKLAQNATKDDPDAEVLQGLEGVRINVYSTGGDTTAANDRMEEIKNTLVAGDWEQFMQVKEENETVHMFMKADGEGIQGMVIMVVNKEEAVFMNILGFINPDEIGSVMDSFDIEVGDDA